MKLLDIPRLVARRLKDGMKLQAAYANVNGKNRVKMWEKQYPLMQNREQDIGILLQVKRYILEPALLTRNVLPSIIILNLSIGTD